MFGQDKQAELKKYTFSIYILQALIFVSGGFSALIGIIINYIKNDDVRGSWLQSHFAWQKNTFWYGLLWTVAGVLSIPILIGNLVLGIVAIWLVYRIARGWIRLVDGKEMYLKRENKHD